MPKSLTVRSGEGLYLNPCSLALNSVRTYSLLPAQNAQIITKSGSHLPEKFVKREKR